MSLDTLQENHRILTPIHCSVAYCHTLGPQQGQKDFPRHLHVVWSTPPLIFLLPLRQCFHNFAVKIPKRVIEANI